jgi:hypothetical protein
MPTAARAPRPASSNTLTKQIRAEEVALRNESGTLRDPQGTRVPAQNPRGTQMPSTPTAAPVVKKVRRKSPLFVGGIVAVLLIISVVNSCTNSARPNTTPDQTLTAVLAGLLGDSNRNISRISRATVDNDGIVEVHWSINNNLTPGLIRDSARQDVVNIVAVVKQSLGVPKKLIIIGDFAVPDGSGHTVERPVIDAIYSAQTLANIKPDGIRSDQILGVADSAEIDPAFQ